MCLYYYYKLLVALVGSCRGSIATLLHCVSLCSTSLSTNCSLCTLCYTHTNVTVESTSQTIPKQPPSLSTTNNSNTIVIT